MNEPEIVQRDAFTLVGIEGSFIGALSPDATNFDVIPALWHRFINRSGEAKTGWTMPTTVSFSLLPRGNDHTPTSYSTVAGALAREVDSPPDGMVAHEVPASMFAVITHRGPIADLPETIRCAMEEWLPNSGCRWNLIEVERYDRRFSIESPQESEMETWLGIVPEGG